MSGDFELPEDLNDSVDIVYFEDEDEEELDNLEADDEIVGSVEELEDVDPPEDKASLTFKDHTRSVFCGSFSSDGNLIVTGGEDDLAFVWDVKTGSVILECTGHKDSVTAASFSHDDKYVVTGDMGGLIQVWDVVNKILVWCYEGDDLEWIVWHHSAYVLIGGVQNGEIYMWQFLQGNCKVLPTNGSKCNCGSVLPNGTQVVAGYQDGNVRVWDLKTMAILAQYPSDGTGPVTDLRLSLDGKLMITCGMPSRALILKSTDCKLAACLQADGSNEIECAAFCPEPDLPIVATGNLNGELCVWDVARQALRHKASIGYTITSLAWGPNALLFAGCVDGAVYVYNGRNGELVTTLTGHVNAVLDVKLSNDAKWLLTTSDDATAKIFDVQACCLVAS